MIKKSRDYALNQHVVKAMVAEINPTISKALGTAPLEDRRNPVAPAIAQLLLEDYGDHAHLEVLTRMNVTQMHDKMWRDVLFYLDELTNERNKP